jgi:bifunctional non-homologous end joining protein LigD
MAHTASIKVGKKTVPVSNLGKVMYPGGKVTKAEVIDYYIKVSRFLLPHFQDRPVTLKRFPDGVFGEVFYEKDAPGFTPDWVQTFPVPRRDLKQPPLNYVLINDAATLAWAANIASLELHPFLHRVPDIDSPTVIAFDLDPGEGTNIIQCAEVAFLLREVMEKLGLKCFPKVSGSKGIQVYVPLNSASRYDETQRFAHAIALLLEKTHPRKIVSDMTKSRREGKVFIDWSQNAGHKTTIGVYSLRAKQRRPHVSLPVKWEELTKALNDNDAASLYWGPEEALERLKKVGDLWAPVLKLKQTLPDRFVAQDKPNKKRPKSLERYEEKRDFSKTAEPSATATLKRSAQGSKRRFVVQKHAASHLHYDFRLEMADVLKSWAVPKGVPLKEDAVASAFETEDHPLEYLDFEGVIPKGQYGGGTVMVWDIGTYEVVDGNFWKGRLSVFLTGKKLKGEWTLERKGEDAGKTRWLLIKTNGDAKPVKKEDRSSISNRTIEQIAKEKSAVWESDREVKGGKPKAITKAPEPEFIQPMKATITQELPRGDEWLYEVKWDGYRALAIKHGKRVRLLSLKNKNLSTDFPAVVDAVKSLPDDTLVLDGEVVAVNGKGQPSFQMLQNRAKLGKDWMIVYYAFDLLNLQGEDLRERTLEERKALLRQVIQGADIRYSAELTGDPEAIVETVKRAGLEGIVAKDRQSRYHAGSRVLTWRKLKLASHQEFVIGGLKPDTKHFQSILVGYYEGKKLVFCGKVRQGFNPAGRASLSKALTPLKTSRCPFSNLPSSKKGHFGEGVTAEEMAELVWLKPKLVAEVSFTEFTSYGLLRHSTFLGLRDDKEPEEVRREA